MKIFIKDYIQHLYEVTGKKRLNLLSGKLDEFKKGLAIDDFTSDVTGQFINFLRHHPRGYRVTTINGYYDSLHFVLNRAAKQYTVNAGYLDVPRLHREHASTVYLSVEEINKLAAVRLRKGMAAVRDHFIIMCYTGLRISDERNLRPEHIVGNNIYIRTQKTRREVIIPIHPLVKGIFERWGSSFPKVPSQQFFSKTIKEASRRAGLNDAVFVEYTRIGKIEREFFHKWEMISAHTGRRSFATNAYLAGIQPAKIMLLTGHTTEQSFFEYIRIGKEENAKELLSHPFFS
jgi:integrase